MSLTKQHNPVWFLGDQALMLDFALSPVTSPDSQLNADELAKNTKPQQAYQKLNHASTDIVPALSRHDTL